MKISKAIKRLSLIHEKHGDIEVCLSLEGDIVEDMILCDKENHSEHEYECAMAGDIEVAYVALVN